MKHHEDMRGMYFDAVKPPYNLNIELKVRTNTMHISHV